MATDDNNPNTLATATTANNTTYLIRFPPFPPIPTGVVIIPFGEFKEHGIRVDPGGDDNETEVDALGVPTVSLGSVHSTDWCKSETKRQRYNQAGRGGGKGGGGRNKKRKMGKMMVGSVSESNWEMYWEEREVSYRRREGYDPFSIENAEASERFYQGAWDFKSGRPWPLAVKQSGPMYVWGEFLRFTGIPTGPEGTTSTTTAPPPAPSKPEDDDDPDSDSDLEGADEDEDDVNAGILNVQNLITAEAAMKAQARTEAFLKDPALMLKVFFSSYARDRGIIWADVNLRGAPILIRFFINFLIDNNVLPKRESNAIKHESTRRILDLALKELPLTSQLAKVWPDEFSVACRECWGSKVEVFVFRPLSPVVDGGATGAGAEAMVVEDGGPTESNWNGWGKAGGGEAKTDEGAELAAEGWGDGAPSGWGTTGDSWGTVTAKEEDELEEETDEAVESKVKVTDHSLTNTDANTGWESLQPTTFFPFLGPTALPLTHTTGIVEASVRRIKTIHPPSTDTSKFPIAKDVSAEAVEGHLRRTFGVVVFEPWVNWNRGEEAHLAMPRILSTSRGVVKDGEGGGGGGALPPFDPHKDEISVLVESKHLELFSVGMGCMCTWVQMARNEDLEPQDPKKKKKKNAKMERFWYVEESLRVIPSYYTYLD